MLELSVIKSSQEERQDLLRSIFPVLSASVASCSLHPFPKSATMRRSEPQKRQSREPASLGTGTDSHKTLWGAIYQ